MSKTNDFLDFEEDFFSEGKKRASRKERHALRFRDRSKFKKSDRDQRSKQLSNQAPPLKSHLKRGRILSISAEIATVLSHEKLFSCSLKGSLKKERTREKNLIAVGDWVHFEEKDADLGVIAHVEKRHSFLARADNLSRRKKQLIAVNIDQVFIVMSLCTPPFKPLLIDRYIIAAKKGNIQPIILINKIDLLKNPPKQLTNLVVDEERQLLADFLLAYHSLEIPLLQMSVSTGENIDEVKKLMNKKSSVFSGQSGVGKSSIINAVIGSHLPVGSIISKSGKGSHTTSTATLLPIDHEGFCIDTPGIKSFGTWDIPRQEISQYFPDFRPFSTHCKFPNCTHLGEPNCGVKQALEEEKIHPLRYASYQALMNEKILKEWE